ncbi:hypothetical protein ARMGADRAFT_1083655 [Armillaria gallica]|uniref:Uncharacterized protein n=1 Tax=Armillaria gallica TaxID=47427 RepID=A0A2H3D7F9_ARMGA|nr:hypothetical protein ARMGADRAFT_1083655 [Armillaria gallica]
MSLHRWSRAPKDSTEDDVLEDATDERGHLQADYIEEKPTQREEKVRSILAIYPQIITRRYISDREPFRVYLLRPSRCTILDKTHREAAIYKRNGTAKMKAEKTTSSDYAINAKMLEEIRLLLYASYPYEDENLTCNSKLGTASSCPSPPLHPCPSSEEGCFGILGPCGFLDDSPNVSRGFIPDSKRNRNILPTSNHTVPYLFHSLALVGCRSPGWEHARPRAREEPSEYVQILSIADAG